MNLSDTIMSVHVYTYFPLKPYFKGNHRDINVIHHTGNKFIVTPLLVQ